MPTPTLLTRRRNPPWVRTQPYTIERPSPVPSPGALVVKKGAKTSLRISSGMPHPVSATQMETYRPSGTRTSFRWTSPSETKRAVENVRCPPPGMASAALTPRFSSACTRAPASPDTGSWG